MSAFFGAVCFLTCAALPMAASRAGAMDESRANELAPGSYVWNPSLASDGMLSMHVDLASQKAYVHRGDTLIGITTIASGRRGYETPDGTFTVLEKERFHNSNKYDNAPMPFMQRLSWSGLALHGGHPHGYPASHGCIRLPMGFAAALFKEDTRGMEVSITGHWGGRGQTMIAGRQRPRTRARTDDLQTTEFSAGQEESIAPDAPTNSAAVPESTDNGEIDGQGNYGADSGDSYYQPGQLPEDEHYNGPYRPAHDRERSRELPPENPPPPPD